MTATNRKTVRKAFAALLATAMVGVGKPVQAVYDFRKGDFQGQSPVVVVSGDGDKRLRFTFEGVKPAYHLQIDIFVLYARTDGTWTEDMAEDVLDDIGLILADTVSDNRKSTDWIELYYTEFSQRLDVVIGGLDYIRETFILEFA